MSFIASLQFASPSHHFLAATPAIQAPTLAHALIAFAVAATGGLVLAAYVLRNKFAPWALSLLHAALGATGLLLLIVSIVRGAASQPVLIGFALLLLAALGGFFLASFHLRRRLPPKAVVVVHAGVAVAGFLVVLAQVL
ncbi:hypothetical protein [Stenotrophomonas sp. NLF4-10]|uniref:hypothetical protein n=1 Tax=Stenotrophomonas sp. NLF4-10 TaxID=2918754 RepID=UPI001EFB0B01|nr:hypothetical protein [Stenotrophomonas sp. NLF4-10]MCG8274919.1 hypothetical protein [Stenotrophomonas sp. NLF4-10]